MVVEDYRKHAGIVNLILENHMKYMVLTTPCLLITKKLAQN
jgi:hypothetical protein